MRTEHIKRMFLVLFGVIIAVLLVEGVLRLFSQGFYFLQDRQNDEGILIIDGQAWQPAEDVKPGKIGKKNFVILAIGESTTATAGKVGYALEDGGNSWPRQLQRILNGIQEKRTYHVINRAVPAIETGAILRKFPGYLKDYQPDLVLAMLGINDNCHSHAIYCDDFDGFEPALGSIVRNTFRTYGLIKWIISGINRRFIAESERVTTVNLARNGSSNEGLVIYELMDPNVTDLHPQTAQNLNDMVRLANEKGIEFIFVQYALRKTDLLRQVIEGNVSYISNYEVFQELLKTHDYNKLFSDRFGGDFGHATVLGNRIIAEHVAKQLLKIMESKKLPD